MRAAAEVQQLIVCGMHSEFCVDTPTRKALALGYPVVLIADGHTCAGNEALSPVHVIASRDIMAREEQAKGV